MNRTAIYAGLALIALTIIIVRTRLYTKVQNQERVEEMIRHAQRYSGATGKTITTFDNKTDRWIAEMKEETVEVIVQKLADAAEYFESGFAMVTSVGIVSTLTEEDREQTIYARDIEALLGNRRVRKAYEDLQKMDKTAAAELLSKNIREHINELRKVLQAYKDMAARGDHKGNIVTTMWIDEGDTYRLMSSSKYPPTPFGRRFSIFSSMLLASLLELSEVRPAIKEAIQFAQETYDFHNSIPNDIGAGSFKSTILEVFLYNPSILMTATLCDPDWNAEKRPILDSKLIKDRKVVDWQARSLEHDMPGREGWVPVVKHDYMIDVRYYKGITDEEFNAFFAE